MWGRRLFLFYSTPQVAYGEGQELSILLRNLPSSRVVHFPCMSVCVCACCVVRTCKVASSSAMLWRRIDFGLELPYFLSMVRDDRSRPPRSNVAIGTPSLPSVDHAIDVPFSNFSESMASALAFLSPLFPSMIVSVSGKTWLARVPTFSSGASSSVVEIIRLANGVPIVDTKASLGCPLVKAVHSVPCGLSSFNHQGADCEPCLGFKIGAPSMDTLDTATSALRCQIQVPEPGLSKEGLHSILSSAVQSVPKQDVFTRSALFQEEVVEEDGALSTRFQGIQLTVIIDVAAEDLAFGSLDKSFLANYREYVVGKHVWLQEYDVMWCDVMCGKERRQEKKMQP